MIKTVIRTGEDPLPRRSVSWDREEIPHEPFGQRDGLDVQVEDLTWEEGFITRYEEHVPHIKDDPDDQVFEYFEISCHKLAIGDAEIDNRWEE